jgi:hypothetical protein
MPNSRRSHGGTPRDATARTESTGRALRRANRQIERGQYAQAYPALKRLADGAAQSDMPVRAGALYAQAARARVQMAAPGAHSAAWDAVALGQRALHLLAGAGRNALAHALLARMLGLLERKHYYEQAVDLRAEGTALLGAKPRAAAARDVAQRPALPAKCPSCQTPLRADELEWIDAQRAECVYCGAVVRAE